MFFSINKIFNVLLLILLYSNTTYSQNYDTEKLCLGLITGSISSNIGEIKSNLDAQKALKIVLDVIGLSKNFIISPCDGIKNVVARVYKGKRYILYDKNFMNQINIKSNDWSSLFILAHEVGHHINGHSLDLLLFNQSSIDPPTLSKRKKQEIEADEFAAFVLGKLGVELFQLEEIIKNIPTNDFSTHPDRDIRLESIKKGYLKSIN